MNAWLSLFLNSYFKQEAQNFQFVLSPANDVAGPACSRFHNDRGTRPAVLTTMPAGLWALSADLAAGERPAEATVPTVCGAGIYGSCPWKLGS